MINLCSKNVFFAKIIDSKSVGISDLFKDNFQVETGEDNSNNIPWYSLLLKKTRDPWFANFAIFASVLLIVGVLLIDKINGFSTYKTNKEETSLIIAFGFFIPLAFLLLTFIPQIYMETLVVGGSLFVLGFILLLLITVKMIPVFKNFDIQNLINFSKSNAGYILMIFLCISFMTSYISFLFHNVSGLALTTLVYLSFLIIILWLIYSLKFDGDKKTLVIFLLNYIGFSISVCSILVFFASNYGLIFIALMIFAAIPLQIAPIYLYVTGNKSFKSTQNK